MAEISKERRRTPRFSVAKSVLYNQANRLASAKTADISSGGIRIISDLPLRKGDAFEFLVMLEGMGLKFKGTVVHTTSVADGRNMVGICFDRSSSLSISLLDDYLKSHINTLPITAKREGFSQMFQSWLKNPPGLSTSPRHVTWCEGEDFKTPDA